MLRLITNITTTSLVFFNTYNQFKAKKEDKTLKKLYDIYFKVLCIYLVVDNLLSFILRIIPFYQLFKLLLIIWLSVPKCSGAVFIYRFYVNGFMRTYEEEMDKAIEKFKTLIKNNLERYKEFAYGKIKENKEKLSKINRKVEEVSDKVNDKVEDKINIYDTSAEDDLDSELAEVKKGQIEQNTEINDFTLVNNK